MKIKTKKGDICPICAYQIFAPNCWVRYHLRYKPEIQILACKYCNLVEKLLRTEEQIPKYFYTRANKIIKFHEKLTCLI